MGILLFFVAIILFIPLSIVNFILVLVKFKISWKTINNFFLQTATDIDRFSNRNFRTLWNLTLKKENGYEFGKINETISSALGKNQRDNTLSKTGVILCIILDIFDKCHCKKSIKD